MKRTTKIPHTYAGRDLTVGDTFEIEDKDVPLLLAMGRIEREAGDPPAQFDGPQPGQYSRRDMVAERSGTLHVKRGYKRKAA